MKPGILFEDRDLIVLDKPAGMQVEKDPFGTPNLEDFVSEHCPREIKIKSGPGIVHRLDKPTSGIVLIAKKASILKQLNSDFAERKVMKQYTAEVSGRPDPAASKLEHFLVKDDALRKAIIHENEVPNSKKAVLSYETKEVRSDSTLLKIVLQTGRYHQIRAQLAHIGHPVIGDKKYDSPAPLARIHLHASLLEFTHPKTEKRLRIESPVPF